MVKCGQIALAHPCNLLKGLAPQAGLESATLCRVQRAVPQLRDRFAQVAATDLSSADDELLEHGIVLFEATHRALSAS